MKLMNYTFSLSSDVKGADLSMESDRPLNTTVVVVCKLMG